MSAHFYIWLLTCRYLLFDLTAQTQVWVKQVWVKLKNFLLLNMKGPIIHWKILHCIWYAKCKCTCNNAPPPQKPPKKPFKTLSSTGCVAGRWSSVSSSHSREIALLSSSTAKVTLFEAPSNLLWSPFPELLPEEIFDVFFLGVVDFFLSPSLEFFCKNNI